MSRGKTLLATVPRASIVPILSTDAEISPSPTREWPLSITTSPAMGDPDVPMFTNEDESTERVEPLHTARASETSISAPALTAMVPLPGCGAVRQAPIETSVAETVPILTRIDPAGTTAVSAAPGVPTGDQLLGVVHADGVVAVQVNVVPAMTSSPKRICFKQSYPLREWQATTLKQNIYASCLISVRPDRSPGADAIDLSQVILRDPPVPSLDILFELFGPGSAGDHTGNRTLCQQPTERQFQQGMPAALGEVRQLFGYLPVALGQDTIRQPLRVGQPRTFRQRDVAPVLAGQQTACQREERQQPQPKLAHRRHQLGFWFAKHQRIFVLTRNERIQPAGLRRPLRLHHLPGGEVGTADVTHIAMPHEIVERAQRLLDRRARIRRVDLIQIDPVGAQPAQAVLHLAHDVAARSADLHAFIVHRHAELGGEYDPLAVVAEDLAQACLRSAALAIGIGGVEQRDAEIKRLVDHLAGRLEVDAAAEIVAAQTDHRHAQTGCAEIADFQWGCPCSEVEQTSHILAAFGRLVKVEQRSDRDDAGRIDPLVALVIVPLDVTQVHRRGDAGDLKDIARIGPQIPVVDHLAHIALEVAVVDGIESHQRGEQPYVRLGKCVVAKEARLRKPLLEPVKRLEQRHHHLLVGGLGYGEACLVDAIVDGIVDTRIQCV